MLMWNKWSWTVKLFIAVYFLHYDFLLTATELVVNVKNQGGEVFQIFLLANVTDETVKLEMQQPDGTIITQFIDFRNEIQIINVVLLGEEEQKEIPYQVLCFVTKFNKKDFIPPDAMAKLRQKNPWTVRVPEKDLGKENITLDVLLDISSADWVSPFIRLNCMDAKDGTYARRDELEAIVASKLSARINQGTSMNEVEGNSVEAQEQFLRAVKPSPIDQQDCSVTKDLSKPCLCELEFCLGWYPCALKYCHQSWDAVYAREARRARSPRLDSGGNGKTASYRCGIHTCKICRRHLYTVPRKFSCMWLNTY